jgi:hypothetical protein
MSGKNTAVFGIYATRAAAEECVDALRRANFRNTDISALFPDNAGTKDFACEKNTKAPEGATAGAASGALFGGVLGWLAGLGALVGFGIPEYEAKRYEGRVKHGGILLSVHCDDAHWVARAEDVLKRTGAEDISSSSEASADFAVSDKPMKRNRSSIVDVPVTETVVEEPVVTRAGGSGSTWE